MDGAKIVQAGAGVTVPAGATRVNLAGKTVMPMIVDTHVHLSPTREKLIRDLKRRAYFGVERRDEHGRRPLRPARRCAARPSPAPRASSAPAAASPARAGPHDGAAPDRDRGGSGQGGAGACGAQGAIWSRSGSTTGDGKYKKLTPEIYGAIIGEAHKNGLRVAAHIFELDDAKGLMRANLDTFAHGVRDKDIDDELVAMFKARPNLVLIPNLPERGVKIDLSWMKPGLPAEEFEQAREGQRRQSARRRRSTASRRAT